MSSTEMRKYITLLESNHDVHNEQILTEIFDRAAVYENIITDIKDKVKTWAANAADMSADMLPSLQKKWNDVSGKLRSVIGTEAVDNLEAALDKKAGSNWMSHAGKIAAAVAVASSLLANPAAAQDLSTRLGLGVLGGLQYQQTRPGYMPHKDPNVVYGQMSPEQALALQAQQQQAGQQIPQHVMNFLIGAALGQLSVPAKIK